MSVVLHDRNMTARDATGFCATSPAVIFCRTLAISIFDETAKLEKSEEKRNWKHPNTGGDHVASLQISIPCCGDTFPEELYHGPRHCYVYNLQGNT